MRTGTNAHAHAYAIECQKCGHAWLATVETIRGRGRAAMRCPVCEPVEPATRVLPGAVAASAASPAPPRLSPELGGKTWVITRARQARV